MKKPLFTFVIFLLVICNSYSFEYKYCRADTTYDMLSFYTLTKDTVLYRKTGKDIPVYEFYLERKNNTDEWDAIKSITIKDSATGKIIQVLDSQKDSLFIVNMEFNDYNFDGYTDMYLYDACAVLGNCFGKVFLFDPKKKIFVREKIFEEMTTVCIDDAKKEVYSFNQCCGGNESDSRIYRYINGKLTIQKQVSKTYSDIQAKYIYTVKEFNNMGKVKTTKVIKSEDPELDL